MDRNGRTATRLPFCAAVRGATFRSASARPPASRAHAAPAATLSACGLPERFNVLPLILFTYGDKRGPQSKLFPPKAGRFFWCVVTESARSPGERSDMRDCQLHRCTRISQRSSGLIAAQDIDRQGAEIQAAEDGEGGVRGTCAAARTNRSADEGNVRLWCGTAIRGGAAAACRLPTGRRAWCA
jgi:hypothetical protein